MKLVAISFFSCFLVSTISGAPHDVEDVRARTLHHFDDFVKKTNSNVTDEKSCTYLRFRTDPEPIPRSIITSFPGSGNTWLRHLIHMATGYYTGSVYNDAKLITQGYKGEHLPWNDNRTVGVKMHQYGIASKLSAQNGLKAHKVFPKTLLLIRNPLRAILSEFNRVNNKGHSHTGAADDALFQDGTFLEFLKLQLPRWGRTIEKWLVEYQGEVHTVCYEKMKIDTFEVVKSLVEFMEVPFERPRCVKRSNKSTGSFKRVSNHSDVTEMIKDNNELRSLAQAVITTVSKSLRKKRLEDCTEYFE